jgi:hypothetical protein
MHLAQSTQARLLEQLLAGHTEPTRLAQEADVPLARLTDWAREAQAAQKLGELAQLHDAQALLLLARCRGIAIRKLLAQCTQSEDGVNAETARRASVDLLKIGLLPGRGDSSSDADAGLTDEQVTRELAAAMTADDAG